MPLEQHTVVNTRATTLAEWVRAFADLVRPVTNSLPMLEPVSRDIQCHGITSPIRLPNSVRGINNVLHGGGQEAYEPTCTSC